MSTEIVLLDLQPDIKKLEDWVNSSLADKMTCSKEFSLATKIYDQIKTQRIETKQKILFGLTKWSRTRSEEGQEYGYLLTAFCCEMLKQVISLQEVEETIVPLFFEQQMESREYNKRNNLCYSLKMILQKQENFYQSDDYQKWIMELKEKSDFDPSDFQHFLRQQFVAKGDPNEIINQYITRLLNICEELKKKKLNASKTFDVKALWKKAKKGYITSVEGSTSVSIHMEVNDGEDEQYVMLGTEQDQFSKRIQHISEHKLLHLIQKREFSGVNNMSYLPVSCLHLAYQTLHDCYIDDPQNIEDSQGSIFEQSSALAICGMMSLLTGLNPVVFADIETLIESGHIHITKDACYWVVQPKFNHHHRGVMKDKTQRYNQASVYKWRIPQAWIIQLRQSGLQGLETQHYNRFLKQLFQNYVLSDISCAVLAQQIYMHLDLQTSDNLLAHLLANHDANRVVGWSYDGRDIDYINQCFKSYIDVLLQRPRGQKWNQEEEPGYIFHVEERIGSQRCWALEPARHFFQQLHQYVQNVLSRPEHNLIEKFYAYSIWMWHLSLICFTVRPVTGMPGPFKNYDPDGNLLYVFDKKSASRQVGRYIPVVDLWQAHFAAYQRDVTYLIEQMHMPSLQQAWLKREWLLMIPMHPKLKDQELSLMELTGDWLLKPMTANFIKRYLSQTLQIYKNWPRHLTKNHLFLNRDIHNTLYAHDGMVMGFGQTSSLRPMEYFKEISTQIEQLLQTLSITELGLFSMGNEG